MFVFPAGCVWVWLWLVAQTANGKRHPINKRASTATKQKANDDVASSKSQPATIVFKETAKAFLPSKFGLSFLSFSDNISQLWWALLPLSRHALPHD